MPSLQTIITALTAFGAWSAGLAIFAWWLAEQFRKTRHTIIAAMDMRYSILDEKIDQETGDLNTKIDKNYGLLDNRVKHIETHLIKKDNFIPRD